MRAISVTSSFSPLQTQTALEAPVRFRPHVDSTTATNKCFLIKSLILICCYKQLQIFNCGPYVQDVLILKKLQLSLLNQQLLQLDLYRLISFTKSTFAHYRSFLHRANNKSHRTIMFVCWGFYCWTHQNLFLLFG